jgi:hypothetical protein
MNSLRIGGLLRGSLACSAARTPFGFIRSYCFEGLLSVHPGALCRNICKGGLLGLEDVKKMVLKLARSVADKISLQDAL